MTYPKTYATFVAYEYEADDSRPLWILSRGKLFPNFGNEVAVFRSDAGELIKERVRWIGRSGHTPGRYLLRTFKDSLPEKYRSREFWPGLRVKLYRKGGRLCYRHMGQ